MHAFKIFKHPERGLQAVKEGFSWPAFFFTSLWSLSRQMWLLSVILILFSVALRFLLWELAAVSLFLPWAVVLVFDFIVGLNGNAWRMNNLYDRGYALLGRMNARSPSDAIGKVAASGGMIPPEMKAAPRNPGLLAVPGIFQKTFAVAALTWKAAFRYRLFWVILALLLGAVIGLPILIRDDGTAAGFAQILITYTLGAVTALLGLCTLWLACGTLARDVEECQMQMVVVKPIARWQIWLGKWLGLVTLNAALLALAGVSVYCVLHWRAKGLPEKELAKLKNEVLVARGSVKEQNRDAEIKKNADQVFEQREKRYKEEGINLDEARKQLREQYKAYIQVVPPDAGRFWVMHLGDAAEKLKDQPLSLRVKFNPPDANHPETYRHAAKDRDVSHRSHEPGTGHVS